MSLGLAKDSFLNLAEMAAGERSNTLEVSGEHNEELVMQVDTHQVSFDRESLVPEQGLGEYARDSLGQFTREDDSRELAELENLLRAQEEKEAQKNAGGDADLVVGEGDDNSRQSSVGSAAMSTEEDASSYGKYAGFDSDYYPEYDELYTDPASYTSYAFKRTSAATMNNDLLFGGGGGGKRQGEGFWCCLFPWINVGSPASIQDGDSDKPSQNDVDAETNENGPLSKMPSREDDEVSTASDVFGEKLSEKDRQAVLARLRLAQPDSAAAATTTSDETKDPESTDESAKNDKGLLNGIVQQPNDGQLKSILRRPSTMSNPRLNKMNNNKQPQQVNGTKQKERRSLFPSYDAPTKPKKNLNVDFADMARVMTVKSHKDMDEEEKGDIWWQRSDYEEFRKTGRMIVRAMLEGGSEIWLASSQSWQTPDQGRSATLKNALSLSEQRKAFERGDMNAKEKYEAARDKWWHKFGHSRRGLEHIASIDEGRQRQANVRIAIKAIVDEQRRQKAFKRGDPEKLRMVSIQHTSWARDLGIAAGASDADVLRQNFNDDSRKSREFFLLKLSRSNKNSDSSKVMPAFMRPAMAFSMKPRPNRLDANTVSQIRYRQTQIKKNAATTSPRPATSEKPSIAVSGDATTKASMAKQAAGYASGNEGLNMSAVLTGMGAMKTPATVGGP